MRYAHTNLIARDFRRLARFYREVFRGVPVPPERAQSGEWLERGTGVRGAALAGVHLRLPGHGDAGPTLEIYQYERPRERPEPMPDRIGLGHVAFEVEDVAQVVDAVVEAGGSRLGEVVEREIPGVGSLTFTYARDPEGNIVELQRWRREERRRDVLTVSSDVAFTPAVKAIQERKGSRRAYAGMEQRGGWRTEIDEDIAAFIAEQTSFFLATANTSGQPYIQHRGGPKGFLRVLDPRTLAFADYRGNRQYVSLGNLTENPKVHLFLIDYAQRARVKIWGEAKVIEDDPDLVESLMPEGYDARPEQAFVIHVTALDENCPQHIPVRLDADDVARTLAERDATIARLEAELLRLRG